MKIPTFCPFCMAKEEFTNKPEETTLPQSLPGEMHDSGVIFVNCPEGHRSAVLYNHRRHEVFFASGAMALLDGYANEAASSFATALERFYEFCIRVICKKQSISQNGWIATRVYTKQWNHFIYPMSPALACR